MWGCSVHYRKCGRSQASTARCHYHPLPHQSLYSKLSSDFAKQHNKGTITLWLRTTGLEYIHPARAVPKLSVSGRYWVSPCVPVWECTELHKWCKSETLKANLQGTSPCQSYFFYFPNTMCLAEHYILHVYLCVDYQYSESGEWPFAQSAFLIPPKCLGKHLLKCFSDWNT